MTGNVLEVTDLRKSYAGRAAVDGATFSARPGEITAVLGPNGAGKTTTIECCLGLRRPDGGAVRVLGTDPHRAGADHRARVGVMLQDGGLPSGARALELLRHTARMYDDPADVPALAARLGVDSFARTPVRRLSTGQRQRLAFALALLGRARVLFLDEPTAGMDAHARREVWDIVSALRADGRSVVLTTHLLDEAEYLADRVIVLHHGTVLADASPAELMAAPADSAGWELTLAPGPDRRAESMPASMTALTAALSTALPGREIGTVEAGRIRIGPPAPGPATEAAGEETAGGTGRVDPLTPVVCAVETAGLTVLAAARPGAGRTLEDVFLALTREEGR